MTDLICQIWIVVFGLLAISLTTLNKKGLRKLGVIVGLISQPAFIITAYINNQSGLLILSVIYIFIWANGILVQFLNINFIEKFIEYIIPKLRRLFKRRKNADV
jgi:hypothetical protein